MLQCPDVSVVVPVYKNAETLQELYRRLRCVFESRRLSYEVIFVNDACPSGSFSVLKELAENDSRVIVLALERNVGQHKAVLTGLGRARGKCNVVMDADLQDPPEAIPALLGRLQNGFSAVFAGRRGRYESLFRLFTSRMFKVLLHLLCGVPSDAGLFVAMNREMVESLLSFDGQRPFLTAMISCTGLPLTSIPVERVRRFAGSSAYSFLGRLKSGLRAVRWIISWKLRNLCRILKGAKM